MTDRSDSGTGGLGSSDTGLGGGTTGGNVGSTGSGSGSSNLGGSDVGAVGSDALGLDTGAGSGTGLGSVTEAGGTTGGSMRTTDAGRGGADLGSDLRGMGTDYVDTTVVVTDAGSTSGGGMDVSGTTGGGTGTDETSGGGTGTDETSGGGGGAGGTLTGAAMGAVAGAAIGAAASAILGSGGGSGTSTIERSIEVNAPVSAVYNQWTQFEEFPRFMQGVESVQQLDDKRLHWHADIGFKEKEWDAEIVDQVPDQHIAWTSTSGARNGGAVGFQSLGANRTLVTLTIDYDPEGLVENVGDTLGLVSRRVEGDLERFKEFIEARGAETGGWRGEIHGT